MHIFSFRKGTTIFWGGSKGGENCALKYDISGLDGEASANKKAEPKLRSDIRE